MAYTEFYGRIESNPVNISWKDIFSEFTQKHDKKDMEYAMLAGTSLEGTDETNMLQRWRKPWLFWRVLLIGLAIGALCIGITVLSNTVTGTYVMIITIVPCIVPVTLMLFFWEMNIPRNVSIYSLFGCFLIGAAICFLVTGILFSFFSFDADADTFLGAPLREELAKLIASVGLIHWFSQKNGFKVYGLTGLVIGAAVGTGFSLFETIDYGISGAFSAGWDRGIDVVLIRMAYASAGHTLYSAPYAAAVALNTNNGKLSGGSFFNSDFAITFAVSFFAHMFWNMGLDNVPQLLKFAVVMFALWYSTLYITRKCLRQAVMSASSSSPPKRRSANDYPDTEFASRGSRPVQSGSSLFLVCKGGYMDGRVYPLNAPEIKIGRSESCAIRYPANEAAVSREHMTIRIKGGQIEMYDTSTAGTFLERIGGKVPARQRIELYVGDTFYVGTKKNRFDIVKK